MDRLTDRTRNHGIYLTGQNMGATGYVPDDVLKRFAAYEDTGLTPEEITANMEMFAAYRHVCGGKSPDEVTQAFAENACLCAERDKAVEDMTSIADAIANCKEYLSGGRDKVSSLQLGRCPACKAQCHDDKPCKFEWRGTEGKV